MNKLSGLIEISIVPAVIYCGLQLFGYENPARTGFQILTFWAVAEVLREVFRHVVFLNNLDFASSELSKQYILAKFPPPHKYGYIRDEGYKEEPWFGQTYLEDVTMDEMLDPTTRMVAKYLVRDIHQSERGSLLLERRMMKLALHAMNKYQAAYVTPYQQPLSQKVSSFPLPDSSVPNKNERN